MISCIMFVVRGNVHQLKCLVVYQSEILHLFHTNFLLQRSLSNTEDECTHLKEMNERTQEELRELANKYNGAVNEIKDLSDKLKVTTELYQTYGDVVMHGKTFHF